MVFDEIAEPIARKHALGLSLPGRDEQIPGHRPRTLEFIAICARSPPQAEELESDDSPRHSSSH